MGRGKLLFWGLFAVTLAVYLAMVLWTLPMIQGGAGGLLPFDLRPFGYSEAEAHAFLIALSPQALEVYLGPQRLLDTAYPGLMGLVLALACWSLGGRWWPGMAAVLVVVALTAAGFDYLENARVGELLLAGPDAIDSEMVAAASFATIGKSMLAMAAFIGLLALMIMRAVRRIRGRNQ